MTLTFSICPQVNSSTSFLALPCLANHPIPSFQVSSRTSLPIDHWLRIITYNICFSLNVNEASLPSIHWACSRPYRGWRKTFGDGSLLLTKYKTICDKEEVSESPGVGCYVILLHSLIQIYPSPVKMIVCFVIFLNLLTRNILIELLEAEMWKYSSICKEGSRNGKIPDFGEMLTSFLWCCLTARLMQHSLFQHLRLFLSVLSWPIFNWDRSL